MDKSELQQVLDEGLKLNRISQTQYDEAMLLFTLIYEEKQGKHSNMSTTN